ncbi:MAG: IS1634 family transposase [Gammaproteobacteria bacterium]|nr:IS1634 family transposase [Gammaproteobacteria bacterium]
MSNGKTCQCHLLRETHVDQQGKVQKRTLTRLSPLDDQAIALIRGYLAGQAFATADQSFHIRNSRTHGPVLAVLRAFERLEIPRLISSTASRERDLACAMIAARLIRPQTRLATTRWWNATTLAEHHGVADAEVDELYGAMDWLVRRQNRIQGKLARRLLADGDMVLHDLTSTWLEGSTCTLAQFGYSRDRKRGKPQLNPGLLCDRLGRPVSLSVHPGNVSDSQTLMAEMRRLQHRFSLSRVILVGDRGMIAQAHVDALRAHPDWHWITALRSSTIRKLQRSGLIDPDDRTSLVELTHPGFPGERLFVCRNEALAQRRGRVREELLQATEERLGKVRDSVLRNRLQEASEIGLRVGKCIHRHRMKKHFVLDISERFFSFERNERSILEEQHLDGICVIRTSLPEPQMSAADCVRGYKSLCHVERAFRTLKTTDLHVRPIHHRLEDRVTGHLFLCMLAYYVEWHMREAWRPLAFADTELRGEASRRDPVAPADRSRSARRKVHAQLLEDGTVVHSFATLMQNLGTLMQNRCRIEDAAVEFDLSTEPSELQEKALSLLDDIENLRSRASFQALTVKKNNAVIYGIFMIMIRILFISGSELQFIVHGLPDG